MLLKSAPAQPRGYIAKLGDFGLARSLVQLERDSAANKQQVLTDYIATRWYRPPEIVTGSTYYSRGVDMWGIGCVIGEMLTGKPLLPGSSTLLAAGGRINLTLRRVTRPPA